jgi:hypothetical protein
MRSNYKFNNPEGLYFVSFAVVGCLAVFTRNEYKDLVLDCLEFCPRLVRASRSYLKIKQPKTQLLEVFISKKH